MRERLAGVVERALRCLASIPKSQHFVWAKDGEVVIQVTGMGPTGTTMVQKK